MVMILYHRCDLFRLSMTVTCPDAMSGHEPPCDRFLVTFFVSLIPACAGIGYEWMVVEDQSCARCCLQH